MNERQSKGKGLGRSATSPDRRPPARGGTVIVPLLYTIAILYLAVTRESIYWFVDVGPYLLKAHHIAAFAVHVVLVRLWARRRVRSKALKLLLPLFASFALGAAIEIVQTLTPYRHARTEDLVDNSIGIALGYLAILALGLFGRVIRRLRAGVRPADTAPEPKKP